MRSMGAYRDEHPPAERLPPRKLVWKTRWDGPGGLVAWLFVGFGCFIATLFLLVGLPGLIAVRAFGETRDAEIVAVDLRTTPSGAKPFYEVRFRHELDGRSHEGTRVVYRDAEDGWPPGIPVAAGEATTVSCFSLGPFHGDDLALPREVAFHRRATEIVTWVFAALGAWAWVLVAWFLGLRPVQRERAIFRDGIMVSGRVLSLETVPRGNKTPLRRVVYELAPLGAPARTATCEARDVDAFARLAVGDIVNVLYDPADAARSQVYEVGAYTFAGEVYPLPSPGALQPR